MTDPDVEAYLERHERVVLKAYRIGGLPLARTVSETLSRRGTDDD